MQNGYLIVYVSRVLIEMEFCYVQIEKEMLVIVFLVEKFNDFIFGRRIVVYIDYKLFELIFMKLFYCVFKRL